MLAAAGFGLAFGAVTVWLQARLTGGWYLLADSGAVWTVVAFVLALVFGSSGRATYVVAGLLALLGEVVGYYGLGPHVITFVTTTADETFLTLAALVLGPAVGLCGWCVRRGTSGVRLAALLALAGVVVGEACHVLVRLGYAEPGRAEFTAGIGLAAASVLVVRTTWPARVAAVAAGVVVAVGTYAVYGTSTI